MKRIKILGIETSCDETCASIVEGGRGVLSNVIASSANIQAKFGGVVPEIASRKHIEYIGNVVDEALKIANLSFEELDGVAVTTNPGLIGALLVGVNYAKALSFAIKKPLIAVNHIEGHIAAAFLESDIAPPFKALVVSGGHTLLYSVKSYDDYEIIGKTMDDAVGEAYDKVARLLGLGYPGGPLIDRLSKLGKAVVNFPKPKVNEDNFDFSYSGLKSSVINYVNTLNMKGETLVKEDIAASFQKAAIDVLVAKVNKLTSINRESVNPNFSSPLVVVGGVACNSYLRESLKEAYIPKAIYCTDNAAMVAARGYYSFLKGDFANMSLNAASKLVVG
ncbi:MAG: tRNA (adenosine(37)-N6)-threonylcarbamoyltransferase complex transferase subunit TsaD [Defluviitaleaceae bacterium]|nr:tRNA (adenosine(37)-N6)-threonylcarbamoyltransferase complex transferase subunit TsaD [Defluviitaleaceae bacterium]